MFFFCYRLERVRSETDSPGWRNSKIIKQRWGWANTTKSTQAEEEKEEEGGKERKNNENTNIQPSAGLFMESGGGGMQGQHLEIHVEAAPLIFIKTCYQGVSMATRGNRN